VTPDFMASQLNIEVTEAAILYSLDPGRDIPIVSIVNNAGIEATVYIISIDIHMDTDTAIVTVITETETFTVTLAVIEDESSGNIYLQPLDSVDID
jgi:hypothetical protein